MKRKLVLENGTEFIGQGFGSDKEVIAELVFNTSMVGYQEILSDPSYTSQLVVMTYPLIGNYGIIDEDSVPEVHVDGLLDGKNDLRILSYCFKKEHSAKEIAEIPVSSECSKKRFRTSG